MSKTRKGKPRTVWVEDDLWEAAGEAAGERGETLSDVMRRALVQSLPAKERARFRRVSY